MAVYSPLDLQSVILLVTGSMTIFVALAFIVMGYFAGKYRLKSVVFLMLFSLFLIIMNSFGYSTLVVAFIVIGALIGGWILSRKTKT